MPDLVLPIFPEGSLTSSVITTTWVGVLVVSFFNLRLGWVFSGIVVPGYLVPLIIIKPWSAAVIGLEAILAYSLVFGISICLPYLGLASSFFGRDRFFAIVLASIAVRLSFDGWVLPALAVHLSERFDFVFDYSANLHSVGLVIVALLANQFWKTGLLRAAIPVSVIIGITWVIVRFVLMTYTNFRIADIGYMYEDLATSILASPKAYIVLVVTAFIASRMNLRYGWEYSGILIPALIALQWYQPLKILTSILEAIIILALCVALLSTPLFRNATIEGARKLLLFFNVGFAYKLALGFLIPVVAPELKVTDYFGFGYLLSTLIAIKMHDKDVVVRMARATLQTSLVGAATATAIGFALVQLPDSFDWRSPTAIAAPGQQQIQPLEEPLDDVVERNRVALYGVKPAHAGKLPYAAQTNAFGGGVEQILRAIREGDAQGLERAASGLGADGFRVLSTNDGFLIVDRPEQSHWGTFILNRNAGNELMIEIPRPIESPDLLRAGLAIFKSLDARGLAIAGASQQWSGKPAAVAATGPDSLFQAFHIAAGRANVLQLRAQTRAVHAARTGQRATLDELGQLPAAIWIKAPIPPALDIRALRSLLGELEVFWGASPYDSLQARTSRGGFAEISITASPARRLAFAAIATARDGLVAHELTDMSGYLRTRLLKAKDEIAPEGSELYEPPGLSELLFLDYEVLTPLVRLLNRTRRHSIPFAELQPELEAIALSAQTLDYRLTRYVIPNGQQFLLLHADSGDTRRRYWGTYNFRLGAAAPYLIQVPRPLLELNTLEAAISLHDATNAAVLAVSGAHARANADGSADLADPANIASVFNLVSQVVQREARGRPLLAVQVRGLGADTPYALRDEDVVASSTVGEDAGGTLADLQDRLLQNVQALGLSVSRPEDKSGREGLLSPDSLPQAQYLSQTKGVGLTALWLTSDVRRSYRVRDVDPSFVAPYVATGIETLEVSLSDWVSARDLRAGPGPKSDLGQSIDRYVRTGDIVSLWSAVHAAKSGGVDLLRLIDSRTRQPILAITKEDAIAGLVHLVPMDVERALSMRAQALVPERVDLVTRFLQARPAWLLVEGE